MGDWAPPMQRSTRAVASSVIAVLALVGTLCVIDQRQAHEHVAEVVDDDNLSGDNLLKAQASALNAERARMGKGSQLKAMDDMVHGFTSKTFSKEEGDEFEKSLEQNAPKKDSLAEQLSPSALGIAPKRSDPIMEGEELNLVQEWTPSGQPELAAQIAKAKQDDEEAEAASSGLKGHTILSATGIVKEESQSPWGDLDLSLVQTKTTSGDWTPQGQSGLASQIAAAKSADEEDEAKENGIKGHGILSAAGVVPEEEETMFLQMPSSSWTPSGQPGLSSAIASAKSADEEDEAKNNGLKGSSILSAVGIAKDPKDDLEINFVQSITPQEPTGENIPTVMRYDREKHQLAIPEPDAIHGDSILAAANMAHHIKPDELQTAGSMDDVKLDLGLD